MWEQEKIYELTDLHTGSFLNTLSTVFPSSIH